MSTKSARILLAGAIWLVSAMSAAALEGVFNGLDEAKGVTLRLNAPDGEQQSGQYIDQFGQVGNFVGNVFPDGVEAKFPIGGGTLYLRAIEHPSGAVVVIIPVGTSGVAHASQTRTYGFVRAGTQGPDDRPYLVPEPKKAGEPIDAVAFVQSYEFWSPEGVGRGYIGVLPRYRSVIALFPALQTDIIWKLCSQTVGTSPGLGEALRGQGVSCSDVLGAISSAQSKGSYTDYKRAVAADRQIVFEAISCARRIGTRTRCEQVAKLTSEAAISLESAATVVAKYR